MDSVVETKDQTRTFVVGGKVAQNTSDNQPDVTRKGMGIRVFEFLDLHIAEEIDNGTDETRLEYAVLVFVVDFVIDTLDGRGIGTIR